MSNDKDMSQGNDGRERSSIKDLCSRIEEAVKQFGVRKLTFSVDTIDELCNTEKEVLTGLTSCINGVFSSPQQFIPAELEGFLKTYLPRITLTLLKRSDVTEDEQDVVNTVFQAVIQFAPHAIWEDRVEFIDPTLYRIFNESNFFNKVGARAEESDLEGASFVTTTKAGWSIPLITLKNVELFGSQGGFEAIVKRLQNHTQKPVPVELLLAVGKLIGRIHEYLQPNFLQSFVATYQPLVFAILINMPDEQLKNEDKSVLNEIMTNVHGLLNATLSTDRANETAETFRLQFALKCFQSSNLEKRRNGLSDIREWIGNVLKRDEWRASSKSASNSPSTVNVVQPTLPEPPSQWITSAYLIEWLRRNEIMEQLYERNVQIEILRRCNDIPRFLGRYGALTLRDLDMMWACVEGSHESIRHIMYVNIADLAVDLSREQNDYLFSKIQTIPLQALDEQGVLLLKMFSINAHSVVKIVTGQRPPVYGESILWEVIQDTTMGIAADVSIMAQMAFAELFERVSHLRMEYLQKCRDLITQGQSVTQVLAILQQIIQSFPENLRKQPFLQALLPQYPLHEWLFDDWQAYLDQAQMVMQQLPEGTSVDQMSFRNVPHQLQVQPRLNFLEFLFSRGLDISKELAERVWTLFVTNALTSQDRDCALSWIAKLRSSDTMHHSFSDEATYYLFDHKVPSLEASTMSSAGWEFFDYFFRYVNWRKNTFQQTDQTYEVKSMHLFGVETLWRVALEANNYNEVAEPAMRSLIKVFQFLSKDLQPRIGEKYEEFIRICLEKVDQYVSQGDLNTNKVTEMRLLRVILLLQMFLDVFESQLVSRGGAMERHGNAAPGNPCTIVVQAIAGDRFEIYGHENDLLASLKQKVAQKMGTEPRMLRLIMGGSELTQDKRTLVELKLVNPLHPVTIHATRRTKQIIDAAEPMEITPTTATVAQDSSHPNQILSRPENSKRLFDLLSINHPTISQQVWNLLMLLPTNESLKQAMQTLDNGNPQWPHLLDARSLFTLRYSLQIVESMMQKGSKILDHDVVQWRHMFEEKGGVSYLLTILRSAEFFFDTASGITRIQSLTALLKIICSFVTDEDGRVVDIVHSVEGGVASIVEKLLDIVYASAVAQDCKLPEHAEVVQYAMTLFTSVLQTHPELIQSFYTYQRLPLWIESVLLKSNSIACRIAAMTFLQKICTTFDDMMTTVTVSQHPASFLLSALLQYLAQIGIEAPNSDQYFELLGFCIYQVLSKNLPANFSPQDLFANLIQRVKQHPIVETRQSVDAGDEDKVLMGLMGLMQKLAECKPELKDLADRSQIVPEVFNACLFDIPLPGHAGPQVPPKCKSRSSRQAAFDLLCELVNGYEPNLVTLLSLMIPQHRGGEKRTTWSYSPTVWEKSSTGYVGLKNLGATCYMNSLMQQLFMIPSLRNGILDAPNHEDQREGTLLRQLQILFGHLQESQKRYYDPRDFCDVYKDYDGQAMDVNVQMDVDEFFNVFFDKLERILASTPQEKLVQTYFAGQTVSQVVCKDCPHRSERLEPFYTIGLDIRNKKSIEEALELFIKGDILDGDNKYLCEACDKRVNAIRRQLIDALPDNLILNLKRFEFDMDTMRKIKVNDYCEFPQYLNMEKYTKEFVERQENSSVSAPSDRPAEYYQYELSGVLVHTGTADSGHYYSFIKEREPSAGYNECRWLTFNDAVVDLFDFNALGQNCFGGEDYQTQIDPVTKRQVTRRIPRINSAYMLFYQRVKRFAKDVSTTEKSPSDTINTLSISGQSTHIPQEIYQRTWDENLQYLLDRNVFDEQYFSFARKVVDMESAPPIDEYIPLPDEHPSILALELAVKFFTETLSHSRDKTSLNQWIEIIRTRLLSSPPACRWFLSVVSSANNVWSKQLLLQCTIAEVRNAFVSFVLTSIATLRAYECDNYLETEPFTDTDMSDVHSMTPSPAIAMADMESATNSSDEGGETPLMTSSTNRPTTFIARYTDKLLNLLRGAHSHWRNFGTFFQVLKDVAQMGSEERQLLLSRSTIAQLVDFFLWEDSPYAKTRPQPRKKVKMGDKFTTPNLTEFASLCATLICACDTGVSPPSPRQFYSRLMKDYQCGHAVSQIACHMSWQSPDVSKQFIQLLTTGISQNSYDALNPYFDVLEPLLMMPDEYRQERVEVALPALLTIMLEGDQRHYTSHLMDFLCRLARDPTVSERLYQLHGTFLVEFLISISSDVVRESAERLTRLLINGDEEKRANIMQTLIKALPVTIERRTWSSDSHTTAKTDDAQYGVNAWRGVQYLRLLQTYLSLEEYQEFPSWSKEFFAVFDDINHYQLECDENKREIVQLLLKIVQIPENIPLLVEDKRSLTLLDFWISLRPAPVKCVIYNNSAQVPFYQIWLVLVRASPVFAKRIMNHTNWNWALTHMLILTEMYPDVANVLLEILKDLCRVSSYRAELLPKVIQHHEKSLSANWKNHIRLYEMLLQSPPEYQLFLEKGIMDRICSIYESVTADGRAPPPNKNECPFYCLRLMKQVATHIAQSPDCAMLASKWASRWTIVPNILLYAVHGPTTVEVPAFWRRIASELLSSMLKMGEEEVFHSIIAWFDSEPVHISEPAHEYSSLMTQYERLQHTTSAMSHTTSTAGPSRERVEQTTKWIDAFYAMINDTILTGLEYAAKATTTTPPLVQMLERVARVALSSFNCTNDSEQRGRMFAESIARFATLKPSYLEKLTQQNEFLSMMEALLVHPEFCTLPSVNKFIKAVAERVTGLLSPAAEEALIEFVTQP